MRNRRNTNSFSKNYNEKLLKRLSYNQFIVYYKEDNKSINILQYKQKNKKLIRIFSNKNKIEFLNAKEVLTLF
jgi:SOS-response transcriptional repressor LexA